MSRMQRINRGLARGQAGFLLDPFRFGAGGGGPGAIGDEFEGGYYGGIINQDGTEYYLIVSPKAQGYTTAAYAPSATGGGTSVIDGPANTAAMDSTSYPAAKFCADLSINGYTDWYLPSRYELDVLYFNLKPSTDANRTTDGINSYAVPPRTVNFTTSNPPQTSATLFRAGGAEAFPTVQPHWTSTQLNSGSAWIIEFRNGDHDYYSKTINYFHVRAIRRVPV